MLIKRHQFVLLFTLILFSCVSWKISEPAAIQDISPPVAKIVSKVDTLFGDVRVDNYYWLRDISNPEVIAYLEAENKYTEVTMRPTEKFQAQLFEELKGRIKETDFTVPEKNDEFYYYTRTEQDKQYPIYCRKMDNLNTKEEILLDQNVLAEGHTYFEIGRFRISPNHKLLAYTVDTTGAESYILYIKDLNGDTLIKDQIANIDYNIEWANDNRTLFYTVLDSTDRPYQIFRHTIGNICQKDILLYQENDGAFFLDISKTRSKKYLLVNLQSKTTTEVYYLPADQPEGNLMLMFPRQQDIEYYVDHHRNYFYILTNENAKNFKLIKAPILDCRKTNWQEVIAHRDSVLIEGIDAFQNYLVVYEREWGLTKLRVINLITDEHYWVDFPEPVYTFWPNKNPDFNTNLFRFTYTSLITPRSVFDYDLATRESFLKKQDEIKGYDPELYESARIFAKVSDGTMVPISLVYKKNIIKNSAKPLLLEAYGAYGSSSDPYFSSNRLSLLNRGFIYAIAHVRGGGEMGRDWYEQGKLMNKKNTFTDFISCAEYLIANNYTSPDNLIITGGSAGGVLIGAVLNMQPALFKGAITDVPFVDVLNTMLDSSIPLTITEYEEWGNPNIKEYYECIKAYSPYDNVRAQNYSNLLITAGLNDPRVGYWESAKWTAKLRALKINKNILLLKINMSAGHGGASGRYEVLKEIAFEYAFILSLFSIKK